MRLLLIAPDRPGTSWAAELEAMTEGHHAVLLTGDVTEERINNRTAGETFDVVHFLTEATNSGIEMVNWTMGPQQVAQLARHVRAELVFLSSCHSVFLPQYLIDQHIPAVLSHTLEGDVAQRAASRMATYFYQELLRYDGDMHKAYDKVSQRDGTLAWSSNGAYLGALEPLQRQIAAMEQREVKRDKVQKLLAWLAGIDTLVLSLLLGGVENARVLAILREVLTLIGG